MEGIPNTIYSIVNWDKLISPMTNTALIGDLNAGDASFVLLVTIRRFVCLYKYACMYVSMCRYLFDAIYKDPISFRNDYRTDIESWVVSLDASCVFMCRRPRKTYWCLYTCFTQRMTQGNIGQSWAQYVVKSARARARLCLRVLFLDIHITTPPSINLLPYSHVFLSSLVCSPISLCDNLYMRAFHVIYRKPL